MASNLGSVFVEISLNDQVYKQKLSETLTSTEATAKGLETSWKALGVKTNEYFDSSRRAAENAYTLIQKSGKYAADEMIRAEEAKNAKIQALNDQQYGKQTSFLDSVKANWVAASAAIVAAWMLVNKAVAYMDEGAKALQIESAFKIMAESSGVNAEHLISNMKAMTKETIDDSDLMQKAVKLMTLGYDPSQIERFSGVVHTAAMIAGTTDTEAYEKLADAIANRMPKALVRMGAVTREQMKIVNTAIEGGADSMVLYELAMANLELKQKMLQGTQDESTIMMQRFHAQVKQTTEAVGIGLSIALQKAYALFQWLSSGALAAYGYLQKFFYWINTVAAPESYKTSAAMVEMKKNAEDAIGAASELAGKAAANFAGTAEASSKASKQEITDSQAKVDAQLANLKKYSVESKKAAEEQKKMANDLYMHEMGLFQDTEEANAKYLEQMTKDSQKQADDVYMLEMENFEKIEKANEDYLKEMGKNAEERAKLERDLYKDIRGYEQSYYEASLILIQSQAKEYKAKGVAQTVIDAWVAQEQEKALIKMMQKSNDFFTGWDAGLREMKNNMMTWGQAGYEMFKTFSETSYSTMSSVLFDGIKGNLKDAGDYFKSFFDTLLKKFTDLCSQMLVQWALVQTGLASLTIGGISLSPTVAGAATTATGAAAGGAVTNAAGITSFVGTGSAGAYGASAMPSTMDIFTPYFTAGAAGYVGGSALAEAIFGKGSGTGGGIGGSIGAMAGYTMGGGIGGVIGGVLGSVVGGWIDSLFGSNAGFGSASYGVQGAGVYGGMPVFGKWNEMSGAKGSADPAVIKAFMDDSYTAIAYTYQKIADYANTLDDAHKTALAAGLASLNIEYLPQLAGLTSGGAAGGYSAVTDIMITRENAGELEGYVKSIPAYILSQVNPVVKYLTGSIVSAKSGLDYIPRDNFLISAHKGEAVITAEENKKRRTGSNQTIQVNLQLDRRTLATVILDMTKDGIKVINDRGIVYQ